MGAAQRIAFYDRIIFADSSGRRALLQSSPLPAPFHLASSLALYPFLSCLERCSVAAAMLAIMSARKAQHLCEGRGETMLQWLQKQKQTPAAIDKFWSPVLVSALNESLDRMEAAYGLDVFWKAFLANRAGYVLGVPQAPLSELYSGCGVALESKGGEIRLRSPVRGLRLSDGKVAAAVMNTETELTADIYVLAVPHRPAMDLLPDCLLRDPVLAGARHLQVSPITGVHFWFDRDVMSEPFLAAVGTTIQWIFNKTRLYHGCGGRYLQIVISASYSLMRLSRQQIIRICQTELRDLIPATREAALVNATVVKEAAATFSPQPGSDKLRPLQRTPLPNLYLAGDWTQTGWPATMEGAVRSGYLAAEAILADSGICRKLVRPDLPVEF